MSTLPMTRVVCVPIAVFIFLFAAQASGGLHLRGTTMVQLSAR